MTGLDTNVLLSWVLKGQARKLPGNGPFRISLVVLAELVWVLDRRLNRSKRELVDILRLLLDTDTLNFQNDKIVRRAIIDFENGNADFADYLIMHDNLGAGCKNTLTFDKKASSQSGFELLARDVN